MREQSLFETRKLTFFLVLTISFCSFKSSALNDKLIGIEAAPSWGYQSINSTNITQGIIGGFNFQFKLHKKLSLKTGLNYFKSGLSQPAYCQLTFAPCPSQIKNIFHLLEIPINIYFDTGDDPEANTKLFFYAGYSIGEIIKEQYRYDYEKQPTEFLTIDAGFLKTAHFLNLGIDIRQRLGTTYYLTIGGGYKQTAMYYDRFRTNRSVQINIRLTKTIN